MKVDKESKLRAKLDAKWSEEIVEIAIGLYGSIEDVYDAFDTGLFDGVWADVNEWAAYGLNETGDLPEHLQGYFDYSEYARDASLSGDIYVFPLKSGEVAVFYPR